MLRLGHQKWGSIHWKELAVWWSDSIGVFFEVDGRGNMKGSRFLWRQVGFSRRSRIFPRNPTPNTDFPTTLEMGRVPRRPGPFWGFKCSHSWFSFILMNKLCLCWQHDKVHCWGLYSSCFGPWSNLDDMTCPFWGKLFNLVSNLKKLSSHACAAPVYLNGERMKFQELVGHTYFAITQEMSRSALKMPLSFRV